MIDYAFESLQENDVRGLNGIKPDSWSSIEEIHGHYLRTPNCRCVKAVRDRRIVGIGTGISFEGTGWLAHIIVASEHQNRGIGSSIVRNRMEDLLERQGCKAVTLTATDQGYPVYKKIGFVEESMYVIMERNEQNFLKGPTTDKVRKAEPRHYPGISKLDRDVSGENRMGLLSPLLDACYVYEEGDEVTGYYIPRFGDGGVIAKSEEAGIALLTMRIKDQQKIFVPEENDSAYAYLASQGYKEVKRIHRMIYGKAFPKQPRCCYSRIGGFAG